jgi:diaminopimelate decarboxylase
LPAARVYYAVKANPAQPVLERLVRLGSAFDVASPAEIDPPDLPPPSAPVGHEGARLAAEQGFDMDPAAEMEAMRLVETGALPEELSVALREAQAMDDKMQNAAETWQAAASCAIRGG